MTKDTLLTEIERQEKYLAELPQDFTFPLFNSSKALESQRQSSYRTTASAAREIVDNSIEAGAKRTHIIFDHPSDKKAHQRKDAVSAVAFIDDAAGMIPRMAQYAMSWGGGTHFDDHESLGRFGFGLPNASINQTKRVEVYTRVDKKSPFTRVVLDINAFKGFDVQAIPKPDTAPLPKFVQEYLDREDWDLGHGTVVVWDKPDRLSYRTAANLKEHLLDDFGVVYRYLLKGLELKVQGKKVEAVDPLFLDPEARYYLPPNESSPTSGGARETFQLNIPVKYVIDPETGGKHLIRLKSVDDLKDPHLSQQGVIRVRVARLPLGFAVSQDGKKDIPPTDDLSFTRFEVRKPRRGMSFVRAKREIETVDVFPRRLKEEASAMGKWPLLQGYAYHWGVEIQFEPALDDVFGISNDKQTVRPMEDFWRVLAEEEVGLDKVLNRENRWQSIERKAYHKALELAQAAQKSVEPSPSEMAAQAADVALGEKPRVPDEKKPAARKALQDKAEDVAREQNRPTNEVREAMEKLAKLRPYAVEFEDAAHEFFYVPEHRGTQVVVRVNKRHPLTGALYGSLAGLPGANLARRSVDLILIALGKAELSDNEQTSAILRAQREAVWSPFLSFAARDLESRLASGAVEEEVEGNGDGESAA